MADERLEFGKGIPKQTLWARCVTSPRILLLCDLCLLTHTRELAFGVRKHFGEASYDSALKWDTIEPVKFQKDDRVSNYVKDLTDLHQKRVLKDREFQYIVSDIEELNKRRLEKSISLSAETRKRERLEDKERMLARENVRRSVNSQKALIAIDEDTELVDVKDIKLNETANILSDLIQLKNSTNVAQVTKVEPKS